METVHSGAQIECVVPKDSVNPVGDKKYVTGDVLPWQAWTIVPEVASIRYRMCEHNAQGNHEKVERPNAQDPSDVEQPERNLPRLLALPEQQRRDQKSTQNEEQIDTGSP